jgi:hypothetical protein
MASPYGLILAGAFFIASGVGAIVVEHRWPGGILSLLLALTLSGFGVRMLVVGQPDDNL